MNCKGCTCRVRLALSPVLGVECLQSVEVCYLLLGPLKEDFRGL